MCVCVYILHKLCFDIFFFTSATDVESVPHDTVADCGVRSDILLKMHPLIDILTNVIS